jgi:DNA-binding MarR family transcriptional regulator
MATKKGTSKKAAKKRAHKTTAKSYPFSFENPEDNAGFLLWQISMRWQRTTNDALGALELTHTQFVVLAAAAWLTREGATATQTDIANHAQLDKMMTSKIVRNLQERGFVERAEHETDTRAKTVMLTGDGQTILKRALRLVEASDNALFELLGSTAEEFTAQLRVLWTRQP